MKKVEAIIRRSKFGDVTKALHSVDIDFFTYWDVTGTGNEKVGHVYRGTVYDSSYIQRRVISYVVREQNLEKSIEAIMKAAQTGEYGDGKIFIMDVVDSVRIRNGERGDESLFIKENEHPD